MLAMMVMLTMLVILTMFGDVRDVWFQKSL